MRIRFMVGTLFALVILPAVVYFRHGGGGGSATGGATFSLDATLPCLQQAGLPASPVVSSTGNRQIEITRAGGPSTYVTFLGSDSEAAWWVSNMKGGVAAAHGLPDDVMFQRRNTMVELGAPSPTELASVDGCLR